MYVVPQLGTVLLGRGDIAFKGNSNSNFHKTQKNISQININVNSRGPLYK